MDRLELYILSISAAAMVTGILCGILGDGTGKELVKMLCGLLILFTVLKPLRDVDLTQLQSQLTIHTGEAVDTVKLGKEMAAEEMKGIIKQRAEAYILDKAASLQTAIDIDIRVEEMIPTAATVSGKISPYSKLQLQRILEDDLGIIRENQVWKQE